MMSNVKNAIGRESLNKTPIDSASRVIHTIKDEFQPNANPLFNKFVQNVWTMIINCLCSTRIAMTYSSDELATAVIYITSGNVGIDLKRDFDVASFFLTNNISIIFLFCLITHSFISFALNLVVAILQESKVEFFL